VALQLAMRTPDMFRRIVTVGGVGKNLTSSFPAEGMNLLMDFTDAPDRDALVRWLHSMVSDRDLITEELIDDRWARATEPATLASARAMYGRAELTAAMAAADASPEPPYWARLHQITAPVLLTWGRDDRVSPLDMAFLPLRTIPRAELHVFPNCGHWTMIEQQQAWESAVLAFLARPDER
jgi:pimeloyl-ACP methyl ester carboxylesterase